VRQIFGDDYLDSSHYLKGPWLRALYEMILGWGTVGLVYLGLGWRDSQPVTIPELWLDHQLSFAPTAIWMYLSFFILIPYTYFSVHPNTLCRLRYSMQISALVSGLFFFLLPTQLNYPPINQQGISADLLKVLIGIDSHQNCFPSLHASLTTICVIMLCDKEKKVRSLLFLVLGVAIGISIIKLRRHLTIDVGAGILVGVVAYYLSKVLESKFLIKDRHDE